MSKLQDQKEKLIAEINKLQNDSDYRALIYGEAIREELNRKKLAMLNLDDEIRRASEAAKPPLDSRITDALRWVDAERIRAARELTTRGILERGRFGGAAAGYLETNEPRIKSYLAGLDKAILELMALEGSPVEGIEAKIAEIQNGVGHLNTRVERIKTTPAIAASLQG